MAGVRRRLQVSLHSAVMEAMVKVERRGIVCLLLDDSRGELQVVLPGEPSLEGLGSREEDRVLFRIKLDDLNRVEPARAAFILGARALAALAHIGAPSIGHRGYKSLADDADLTMEKDLYSRAADGGPALLFEIALEKMFEATHRGDAVLLEATEEYLKQAAAQGSDRAQRFLTEIWPTEKESRQRLIDERNRRSSSG